MEISSSTSRGKRALATKPWWGPSATAEITTAGLSEPKNDLSSSKWATTTKYVKTAPITTTSTKDVAPTQHIPEFYSGADNFDLCMADMSPRPSFSHNVVQNYGIPADVPTVHPRQNLKDTKNYASYNHVLEKHIQAPPPEIVCNDISAIPSSDTLDDDGDVVMIDLNDPGIIKMVAELTRNERQTKKTTEYADLKPGLRPTVSKSRISQPSCLLIIDTSFIISHLQLVDNLVNSHSRWKNVVVMPWATIQELDGLKKSSHQQRGVDLGKLARSAINWAFAVFGRLDPGVWGQSKEECEDSDVRGDSAILECCRYFGANHETILLSNDRNLCVQAMIHNIKTVTITGEVHTAEAILTRILGNSTNIQASRESVSHSQPPPPENPSNLVYNPASDYTPPNITTNHQAYVQPIYKTVDEKRQIIQPAFYPTTTQDETDYLPYGIKEHEAASRRTTENGLETSIYAAKNVVLSPQYSTQAVKISRPPLGITRPSLELEVATQKCKSDVEIKKDLNNFLQGISADLVINLVPLLKDCARDKLTGPTEYTPEALNCCPEKQVRSIIDLEKFLYSYWVPVFREYLPADYGHVFKNGELNRRWSEWMYWTEFGELGASKPKMKELKKWIELWDFVWKRILSSGIQADVNMDTVDRWRTVLLGIELAAE